MTAGERRSQAFIRRTQSEAVRIEPLLVREPLSWRVSANGMRLRMTGAQAEKPLCAAAAHKPSRPAWTRSIWDRIWSDLKNHTMRRLGIDLRAGVNGNVDTAS